MVTGPSLLRAGLILLGVVGLVLLLVRLQELVIVFVIAVVLAEGLRPLVGELTRRGLHFELARASVYVTLIAALVVVGIVLTRPVVAGRPTYVYYLPSGARQPILLDGSIARPNGLTLTGDGRTLIVDDTLNPTVFVYDVQPDGSVKNKRAFTQLRDIPAGSESGADGIAIDRDDRVYITTVTGVQVFDAKGQYLGTIKVARQPANAAFAGPGKQTLYITAREGLYRVRTLAKGPDRLGK